jgi:hypothetical protein
MWGATLGLGILSYVPFASYHVLVAWMFFSGSARAGFLMGLVYGTGRTAASLVPAVIAARNPERSMTTATGALTNQQFHRGLQVGLLFVVAAVLAVGRI